MKKLLSILLATILIITAMPLSVFNFTASAATSGYYTYSVSNGEATITDISTSISGSITIPSTLGGYPVTSIGSSAFSYCSSLTSITIPDSVTSIGTSVFYGCSSLTSITIPDSVTSIGTSVFYGCSSLTSITIPDSVTSIGGSAFYNCSSLTSIIIPDSVTSIGGSAFYYCSSLTSITIPDSVTSIGDQAFSRCSSLKDITVDENNNYYLSVNGVLFNKDKTELICYPDGKKDTTYVIPDSVTSIGDYAFWYCDSFTNITIPDSVTSIGGYAFRNCRSLTSITIPDSVTSIRPNAFENCSSLSKVVLSKNITFISGYTFRGCSNLVSITIPEGVTKIAIYAFADSANLKSITLPVSLTSIDGGSFQNCSNFKYVYYRGSQYDKENINITYLYNSELSKAIWYYNSCIDSATHNYDNNCDTDCNTCGYVRTVGYHVYDNACDTDCNECGNTRTVPDHTYEYNGGNTCSICKYSKAPDAPDLDNKYSGTVALVATEGFEYSTNGINWQDSNIFTAISENTTHTFYQRVKASDLALVSDKSEALIVTMKASQTTPDQPIVIAFSDTVIYLLEQQGMEYSVDGINWQSSAEFNNLSPATTYTFYQRLAETDSAEASDKSEGVNFTTDKAEQKLIPAAPTALEITANSITLTPVEGCEYSKNGRTWQSSNVFNYLSSSCEYTFYQRYKENETTYVGEKSKGLTVKTLKGAAPKPSAPTLLSKTHNTVTLVWVDGYEYSKDGVNWQTSNIFTGLMPKMNYMFYQRVAETEDYYASDMSSALAVKTNEQPVYTPGDIDGDDKINLNDLVTIAQYVAGWENLEINEAALDVNGDGSVDLEDVTHLARYLAGWEGIELH